MNALHKYPGWAEPRTVVALENAIDDAVVDRFLSDPDSLVPKDKISALLDISDLVMEVVYATVDAQVTIYQNRIAYNGQ